ncbi:transporter substrate-binding domain-containing protein [Paucibacter sp. PLA-PC-4]|uniref:transporter substrate-binding domain-containing protein n=1 Tax=Paucibacter sp. PLA-PC-4 TaxID=2993655 RepID=UPI0022499CB0|nr:transporter substrate-binding domain-containing protein [Paucibacter sp. PLA-PC-4]MCX2862920.1 transporter substrate-binding domain-containing protein [Paucibacter sp. PLA-PC-4]
MKNRALSRTWFVGGFCMLVLLGAWWALQGDGSLARVQRAGVLRIGYAVEAPYAMLGDDGAVLGEAPTVARLVAQDLGLPRIEWVRSSFDELIPGLQARRFDVVAAGMFVTPERARRVLYSDPSVRVLPGLLVRRGNPHGLRSEADLRDSRSARVAVLQGSVEAARLRQLGLTATRLIEYDTASAAHAALLADRVQALCLSFPTVRHLAAQRPEDLQALRLRQEPGAPALAYAAFQFHLQDLTLQQNWMAAQAALMGSPRHLRAIEPYGFSAEDLPGAVRSAHLTNP